MRKQLAFYLRNFPGLSALVGDRVYPQRAPTSAQAPYVVLKLSDDQSFYDQDGIYDYQHQNFDIECNGETIGSAADVNTQVKQALKIQNILIGDTGKQEYLNTTTLLGGFDNFDLFDGSQVGIRTVTLTFRITYKEA